MAAQRSNCVFRPALTCLSHSGSLEQSRLFHHNVPMALRLSVLFSPYHTLSSSAVYEPNQLTPKLQGSFRMVFEGPPVPDLLFPPLPSPLLPPSNATTPGREFFCATVSKLQGHNTNSQATFIGHKAPSDRHWRVRGSPSSSEVRQPRRAGFHARNKTCGIFN